MEVARQGYVLRGSLGFTPAWLFYSPHNSDDGCRMHLLYVDESGNADGNQDTYFVLGGVAVFEREIYWINEEVNALANKYFPGTEIEFHAQAIASHAEEPWHSCPTQQRNQIIDALSNIIASHHVTLSGINIEEALTTDPISRAFEEICNRCDLFMHRLHAKGDTQHSMRVATRPVSKHCWQNIGVWVLDMGARSKLRGRPFFANSKATRLLQLADLVAYAVFRRYERGDTRLIDKIISRFDTEDGVIHGSCI